ncbi:hypothetical protein CRENBAI_013419 [Crenichthys baileyi]|uniref:Transmembrane protein 230 n=1 Tax=Crenichthys baileyi TaxID=28760 RepID=A0AAV9SRH2_9TELE
MRCEAKTRKFHCKHSGWDRAEEQHSDVSSVYLTSCKAGSNMLTSGLSNNKVKYSRLAADDDGYIDLQFKKSPPKVPYKAIGVAIFLFLIGSLLIVFGALFLAGVIKVEVWILCFVPRIQIAPSPSSS